VRAFHKRSSERDLAARERVGTTGRLAILLAVLGGIAALINETLDYRRTGSVDWGHVALALGVPFLMYVIVRTSSARHH
jgi:hypothetical protein